MREEVHVRFDSGGASDAVAKVHRALGKADLVPELDPKPSDDGVLVLIYKGSWDAVSQQQLRAALQAEGLPGTFAVEAISRHGYE